MWCFLYNFVKFVYPPTGRGGFNENPYAKLLTGAPHKGYYPVASRLLGTDAIRTPGCSIAVRQVPPLERPKRSLA